MQVMKVMKNLFNIKIQLQIGDFWMAKSDACKSSYQEPHSSFHHRFQQWGHGSKYDLSPKRFTTEYS